MAEFHSAVREVFLLWVEAERIFANCFHWGFEIVPTKLFTGRSVDYRQ